MGLVEDDGIEAARAAELREQHVAALRRERGYYEARGETDRVADVDGSLADYGVLEDGADGTPRERAVRKKAGE